MGECIAIHPFREGNGRTAFILGNLILMQNDLLPLDVYDRRQDEGRYFAACEAVRIHKDYAPLAASSKNGKTPRSVTGREAMARNERVNVKAILADPDLRRELMVRTIQATQAREGIETTEEQAERAYYVVTESERTSVLSTLKHFRGAGKKKAGMDTRNEVRHPAACTSRAQGVRFDVADVTFSLDRREPRWRIVESGLIAARLRRFAPLESPQHGHARSGLNTGDRSTVSSGSCWEIGGDVSGRSLGDRSRREATSVASTPTVPIWYSTGPMTVPNTSEVVASKYGSSSRFVKSEDDYFNPGITWPATNSTGIQCPRIMPAPGIFGQGVTALSPRLTPSSSFFCWDS